MLFRSNFNKIKAVGQDFDDLIEKLLADQSQRQYNKSNEPVPFSIYSTDTVNEEKSTSEINGYFIHSQLLIDCLLRMSPNSNEKKQILLLHVNDTMQTMMKNYEL